MFGNLHGVGVSTACHSVSTVLGAILKNPLTDSTWLTLPCSFLCQVLYLLCWKGLFISLSLNDLARLNIMPS